MCNGTIPPTIARKTDFDSKICELEQKNEAQQTKIDELDKHIQQHSAMFMLLRQRIEALEKN